ncbi:MAG: hypothetical protein ACFFDF_18930 [Candidatus Odinarchaeota archaeon]
MDTGADFIRPEFLNIIFFQQRNLVIFPYVDLKHLHGLEIFTVGYNVVDLESTALHNLKEILEFESNNSYSHNPTLYFIYNVDREKVKELMKLEEIHCIINTNEIVGDLANDSKFVFFNKKSSQFLNYDPENLEFEESLIANSQDEDVLQENIQKIKIVATRIFKELNQSGSLETLPDILGEYDMKYWNSILEFTARYYDINIPNISKIKFKPQKVLKDFSDEYEVLISTNRPIGKEFIQLLHDYRSKKVNPAHLELEELYNPQKLYNYLRNHHWKSGIPKEFVQQWYEMNISNYKLTESDQIDFELIAKKLNINYIVQDLFSSNPPSLELEKISSNFSIPSPRTEWNTYKLRAIKCLDDLEKLCRNSSTSFKVKSYLLTELSEFYDLLRSNNHKNLSRTLPIPETIKQEIISLMNKFKILDWVNIYGVSDRYRFVSRFITQFDVLYEDRFDKDEIKDTPPRIKRFEFPQYLEKKLLIFNRIRNRITHSEMTETEINKLLNSNKDNLNNTYLNLLSYLLRTQIRFIAQKYNINELNTINEFVIGTYLKNNIFSPQEINKVRKFLKGNIKCRKTNF